MIMKESYTDSTEYKNFTKISAIFRQDIVIGNLMHKICVLPLFPLYKQAQMCRYPSPRHTKMYQYPRPLDTTHKMCQYPRPFDTSAPVPLTHKVMTVFSWASWMWEIIHKCHLFPWVKNVILLISERLLKCIPLQQKSATI